jgi:UDP-glucose 4-epimerase
MAVLVTGGAGHIGSHMLYAFLAAGERVIVLASFDRIRLGTGDQNLV